MNNHTLFTLVPFLLVVGLAIFMVLYKKKSINPKKQKRQGRRFVPREPTLSPTPKHTAASAVDELDSVDENPETEAGNADATNAAASAQAKDHDKLTATDAMQQASPKKIKQMIIIGLIAEENQPYRGYELLQTLLTAGLRFNRRGVFYRHQGNHGQGEVLFALASAEAPGVFDLPKMGSFVTKGLTLFIELEHVVEPLKALDIMLATARQLVDDLGGSIWDDAHQPLTEQKILQWRQQLQGLCLK